MTEHRVDRPSLALSFLLQSFSRRFPRRGEENYIGLGIAGGTPLKEPLEDEGRAIRSGEKVFPPYLPGQPWKNASKKLFWGAVLDYHTAPLPIWPSEPDGPPPPGQDQQFKFDLQITYCTFCRELEILIEFLTPFGLPFGIEIQDIPAWIKLRFLTNDGTFITDPKKEEDHIYNLVVNSASNFGYKPLTEEEYNNGKGDEIYNNFLDLLNKLYKEFCPCDPRNELPDDLLIYAFMRADIEEEGTSPFLGLPVGGNDPIRPKWRRGIKLRDDTGREGMYYSPPEGSPTPFY